MNATISDLQRDLSEAMESSHHPVPARAAQIRRRVIRQRRQRTACGLGALVTLTAASLMVTSVIATKPPLATTTPAGLPLSGHGGRLLAQVTLPTVAGTTQALNFQPDSWELTIVSLCTTTDARIAVQVTVNGKEILLDNCTGGETSVSAKPGEGRLTWQRYSVTPGQAVTWTVRAVRATEASPVVPAKKNGGAGEAYVGVYNIK